MDAPTPPPTPDPYATADAQGRANVGAARTTTQLNRVDQFTPYGSLIWHQGTATPPSDLDNLYRQYLGRDADPYGYQYYTNQLNNGGTLEQVAAAMQASPEYRARQAALALGGTGGTGTGTGSSSGSGTGTAAPGQHFNSWADMMQAVGSRAGSMTTPLTTDDGMQYYVADDGVHYNTGSGGWQTATGGSAGYTPDDHWWSEVRLDPRVQSLLDSQLTTSQGLQNSINTSLGRVNDLFSHGIDYSQLPAAGNWGDAMADAQGRFTDPVAQREGALALATRGQDMMGDAMDRWGQMAAQPIMTQDAATRQRVEDALYSRATSRLDPQYEQQQQAMIAELRDRGVPEGSEAWNTALSNFSNGKNDAYNQALWSSIAGGGQEEQRQQQMELAARDQGLQEFQGMGAINSGLSADANNWLTEQKQRLAAEQGYAQNTFNANNAERSYSLAEQEAARARVLNELASLRTGSQVQMPQFSNTPSGANVQPAPVAQSVWNAYQGQMNNYNQQVASNNAFLGMLGQLGGAALGAGGSVPWFLA